MAYDARELDLQAKIKIRLDAHVVPPRGSRPRRGLGAGEPRPLETTLGRALFNEALPIGLPVRRLRGGQEAARRDRQRPGRALPEGPGRGDARRAEGRRASTGPPAPASRSPSTTSSPRRARTRSSTRYEERAEKIQKQYERGLITDDERRQELIEIWTEATNEVAEAMEANFPKNNPIYMMVDSGARGNMMQVRQIAGMRGLVANPKGEIIPRPIKSNFREGLSVLEYFISTHGARKGLADTALRTADSGYLTRRLVDVAQDVIIREDDCGTERGIVIADRRAERATARWSGPERRRDQRLRAHPGRPTSRPDGKVLAPAGADLGDVLIGELIAAGVERGPGPQRAHLRVARSASARMCYGRSLATGKLVDVGEAVGIIAAQSIGEPGTQLTMRTFHTGGVAGEDITHGLPRVVELFEARQPKGKAPITEVAGRVSDRGHRQARARSSSSRTTAPRRSRTRCSPRARGCCVAEGEHVEVGQQLHRRCGRPARGAADPRPARRCSCTWSTRCRRSTARRVCRSTTSTSRSSSARCCKRVNVLESGDTDLLPGELVERPGFEGENRRRGRRGRSSRPRPVRCSWASPRPRWPPSRGCPRRPSRRPPGCSPTRRSTPAPTACSV